MKLLFVSPRYHPHVGGVEYVVKSIADRLAKRSYSVTVLCGDSSIDNPKEETINGVSIVRWPVWAPGNAYHIPRMRSKLKNWLLDAVKDCDVVHFHSVHSMLTMYSLGVLKECDVHKVLTPYYHGSGHTFFRKFLWKGWRSHVRGLMRFVDTVHTVSKLEAQLVKRDFGADAVPIENGVDEWVLNINWTPSGYVMYSGRIEKYKNIHRLANIVKILNTKFDMDLELKIFGVGSFMQNLTKILKDIGIRYEVNPFQPYEKYIEYLSRATLFGLLSEKESYPQTINEANTMGVPVIIVEPWGLSFYNRNRTLILNLSKDDETIAKEVVAFIDECRKQPKSEVPSWDQVVNTYVKNLYKQY
ncbi:MAG: glycosyltransferase family 4 protein [Sulfolobales archaeon]|nr:glycosyltransferase family 4 protein [Sulfolobales archaeon]